MALTILIGIGFGSLQFPGNEAALVTDDSIRDPGQGSGHHGEMEKIRNLVQIFSHSILK